MKILVLGSAAGGGFPQWNCHCRNCAGLRAGTLRAEARSQSSIAVAGREAGRWVLVNASPDIRAQIEAHPTLQPARGARDTPIAAIVLADAQIDHTAGLYILREAGRPWPIYCTDRVHAELSGTHPVFGVLSHYCGVERHRIPTPDGAAAEAASFAVPGSAGVRWHAIPVASKPPPFSAHRSAPQAGDNLAFLLRDEHTGRSALYAPGLAEISETIGRAMRETDCVLVDGTFWTDDEMLALSGKRAHDMGHLPQSGAGGMLERLGQLPSSTRKILIHINNTNPILDEDSAERAELERRGIEVARDGMEIEL